MPLYCRSNVPTFVNSTWHKSISEDFGWHGRDAAARALTIYCQCFVKDQLVDGNPAGGCAAAEKAVLYLLSLMIYLS